MGGGGGGGLRVGVIWGMKKGFYYLSIKGKNLVENCYF